MNQVHKENLTHVENANPGRQGLDIEIFGMEGVPAEIIDQHNQQVTQAHFAEEEERARITGNPIRGLYANGQAPLNKRSRVVESLEEIEERAAKYRTDRKNGVLPVQVVDVVANPVRENEGPDRETATANALHRSHPLANLLMAPLKLSPTHSLSPPQTAPSPRGQARYQDKPARCLLGQALAVFLPLLLARSLPVPICPLQ